MARRRFCSGCDSSWSSKATGDPARHGLHDGTDEPRASAFDDPGALEDIDPARAQAGFALGEPLPPLRAVVDQWTRKHPDRSVAIVLDEIDTILRTERRAYLLGEWREAATIGQALASLMPPGAPQILKVQIGKMKEALKELDFPTMSSTECSKD